MDGTPCCKIFPRRKVLQSCKTTQIILHSCNRSSDRCITDATVILCVTHLSNSHSLKTSRHCRLPKTCLGKNCTPTCHGRLHRSPEQSTSILSPTTPWPKNTNSDQSTNELHRVLFENVIRIAITQRSWIRRCTNLSSPDLFRSIWVVSTPSSLELHLAVPAPSPADGLHRDQQQYILGPTNVGPSFRITTFFLARQSVVSTRPFLLAGPTREKCRCCWLDNPPEHLGATRVGQ